MARRWASGWIALSLSVTSLCLPSLARGLTPGEVYWVPGFSCSSCGMFEVSGGGDQQGASPFAATERSPGQLAWASSPVAAYLTQFDSDAVVLVDADGAVTSFATGIPGPTGIVATSAGGLLAASFWDGAVYEISAGGDFAAAQAFASGFGGPRNLLELANGEILLADQSRRAVYEISNGGDFSQADPFASGFPSGPLDLVRDGAGRIFASTDSGVFEILADGSVTAHATGRAFAGLAIDAEQRLLASDLDSGAVFEITTAGDYSGASPFAWNLDGLGDSALDTVPGTTPSPPGAVPSLSGGAVGLLAGLLAATGVRGLRRHLPRLEPRVATRRRC
jgi:hypothetical protein